MLQALKNSIKTNLKGDYKSVDKRLSTQVDKLVVLFYRLIGRSWIDYYADRLDANAGKDLGDDYLDGANVHLQYLQAHGLTPDHVMLDYGCGWLRTGGGAIRFLKPGHYFGVDISAERIKAGCERLVAEGIDPANFEVHPVRDCLLREVAGQKFDTVWANSVFSHMPGDDISAMLAALRPLLAIDGQFVFNFVRADRPMIKSVKSFSYEVEEMRALCEAEGYAFELLHDWDYTTHQMARVVAA
ncbi:MAG: class I SAM-dependent methyltransferase [Rhodospirillaceae bacterium]|nr:class I SAM-dependent methyltransferase [Rhodospirillaceae bacterium]